MCSALFIFVTVLLLFVAQLRTRKLASDSAAAGRQTATANEVEVQGQWREKGGRGPMLSGKDELKKMQITTTFLSQWSYFLSEDGEAGHNKGNHIHSHVGMSQGEKGRETK